MTSDWASLFKEGELAVKIVREGLERRGFNVRQPMITLFNTDEDIPIYDDYGKRLFWISVKGVASNIKSLEEARHKYQRGWMCGEVESKQWVNPPAVVIWYCPKTGVGWGAITPRRPSEKWIIYPYKHGIIQDTRKTVRTGITHYIYPSYHVPPDQIISKEEVLEYISQLVK
jgi:hypothetical protein